ncbi:MAG: glycoside hydrolase family 44 protein, partial [Ruminococcus sp.]
MSIKKRNCAGILAAVMLIGGMTPVLPISSSAEENGYDMNVSVNLSAATKSISPYIYGVNDFGDNLKNVTVNAARQGGNRYTGYNWETNWSNAGEDWHNSSDTNIGDDKNGPAYAAQSLSKSCASHNVPYKMTTLQMAGYVAADKNGSVSASEAAPSARWNEVKFRKDSELSLTPDLDDGVVYMDEYVNYIVNKLGPSTSSTGIQGYSLDNEPALWDDTHPYLHGESVTNNELISKSKELAKVVKQIDPNAEVFGPAFWGIMPCISLAESDSFKDPEWQAVKDNYNWYVDFYLDQMKKAEDECGVRLLDVLDVHYYAQDCSTDAARLQAARSLYDESYKENSWLQPYFGQYFPFITRLQESIQKYYPETKLAFSEYNLGDISNESVTGKSVTTAIAEAEALGAFASNDVYLATYWGSLSNCPYVESAINLYTNYDGEGGNFGDTLVEAKTDDISLATAFAAVDEDSDSEVTLVLSNKDMSKTENAVISLEGASVSYQSAVVYAVTQEHSDIRIVDVQNDVKDNKLDVELPPISVAQILISD